MYAARRNDTWVVRTKDDTHEAVGETLETALWALAEMLEDHAAQGVRLAQEVTNLRLEASGLRAHARASDESPFSTGVLFIPDTLQFAYPQESLQALADTTGVVVIQGPDSEFHKVEIKRLGSA